MFPSTLRSNLATKSCLGDSKALYSNLLFSASYTASLAQAASSLILDYGHSPLIGLSEIILASFNPFSPWQLEQPLKK